MTRMIKPILWMGLGAGLGAVAMIAISDAVHREVPDRVPLEPPPAVAPPPIAETPPPPPAAEEPRIVEAPRPPDPPAPPPAPPSAGDFFGFPVATLEAALPPPPPPSPPPVVPPPPKPPIVRHRYVPVPGKCVAGFDATSTLHDFRGLTQGVTGMIEFEKDRMEASASAAFTVDARSLDTGNPDRDKEMHADHLQSSTFPEMKFTLRELHPAEAGSKERAFTAKGTVEIHGRRKEADVSGTFELRPDGYLHVTGGFPARLTEFGIPPPTTALVIRVADEIKVWFEVWAVRQEVKR